MLMPGRRGYAVSGGWATAGSSSSGVPASLSISSRIGNEPAEYVASESIAFTSGFESGSSDEFQAYLGDNVTNGSNANGGAGGTTPNHYRYTFNGKEFDEETETQDYGMRIYNPALGKFLSVDPITKKYPELTPYQFASNTPIQAVDLDGKEAYFIHGTMSNHFRWINNKGEEKEVTKALFSITNNRTRNTDFEWGGF